MSSFVVLKSLINILKNPAILTMVLASACMAIGVFLSLVLLDLGGAEIEPDAPRAGLSTSQRTYEWGKAPPKRIEFPR